MNIFFLSPDPEEAAKAMVDKHIIKMPVEAAQMLSSSHRMLDGELINYEYWNANDTTSVKKMWVLPEEEIQISGSNGRIYPIYTHPRGVALYKPTHMNHPSSQWTRSGRRQYEWHYALARAMLDEYTKRYGKKHGVERLMPALATLPANIPDIEWTDPPLAMPDQYKLEDHVESYRRFYIAEKAYIARWKTGVVPDWFKT